MDGDLYAPPQNLDAVLAHMGATGAPLLGEGGEALVFALGDDRVLRVARAGGAGPLVARADLLEQIASASLPFAVPVVLEVGELDGTGYWIERRIRGTSLTEALPRLRGAERQRAWSGYVEAAGALRSIDYSPGWFGEVLGDAPVRRDSWPAFLVDRAGQTLARSLPDLRADLPGIDDLVSSFAEDVSSALGDMTAPGLVHGDWFPGNVLVAEDGTFTAAIDFGPLTLAGDWRMDVAGAVIFTEVVSEADAEDRRLVHQLAERAYGTEVMALCELYRRYYALYFSFIKAESPAVYQWCVESLRR